MALNPDTNKRYGLPSPSMETQPASSGQYNFGRFAHFGSAPFLGIRVFEKFYTGYSTYTTPYPTASPPHVSPFTQRAFPTPSPTALQRAAHPDFTEEDWRAVRNLCSLARQGVVSPIIDIPIATTDTASPSAPKTTANEFDETNISTSSRYLSPVEVRRERQTTRVVSPNTHWKCNHRDKATKVLCGKQFSVYQNYQTHLSRHKSTDDGRYKCHVCGKNLAQQSSLNTHLRTHNGDKPYKCGHCGQCFSDGSSYKKHVRTHTGEKPFPCRVDSCVKTFNQSGNRIRHESAVHGYLNSGNYHDSPCNS